MKRSISIILVVLMGLTISNTQTALATIITVDVEGVVNYLGTGGGLTLDGSVSLGSLMTGSCSYDTQTPDLGSGSYAMISISMTIGNYTFTHNPASSILPLFDVHTVDPGYVGRSGDSRFDGTIYVNETPKTYDDIAWNWAYLELFNLGTSSSEYITSIVLPDLDSWPELSIFDNRREFRTSFYDESDRPFNISGEVTSLTVIPEPATLLLLGLGGLALLRRPRFSK